GRGGGVRPPRVTGPRNGGNEDDSLGGGRRVSHDDHEAGRRKAGRGAVGLPVAKGAHLGVVQCRCGAAYRAGRDSRPLGAPGARARSLGKDHAGTFSGGGGDVRRNRSRQSPRGVAEEGRTEGGCAKCGGVAFAWAKEMKKEERTIKNEVNG